MFAKLFYNILKCCTLFTNGGDNIFFKCLTYISTIFATTCTAFAPIVRLAIFLLHSPDTFGGRSPDS